MFECEQQGLGKQDNIIEIFRIPAPPLTTTATVLIRGIYTRKISHGLHKMFQVVTYIRRDWTFYTSTLIFI